MTCNGCVRTVSTLLNNQPGITQAVVTLAPGEAEITFEEEQTTPQKLAAVLSEMGYEMAV